MRTSLLLASTLALTGCISHRQTTQAELGSQDRFSIIHIDSRFSYLIDPRTESCFLRQWGGELSYSLVAVPCDKLKRNLPEAAPLIRWIPDAPASTP